MNMRILITGCAVFVIWSFLSAWLYVEKIKPAMNEPAPVQLNPEPRMSEADSLMQLNALMPQELIIYFDFDKIRFIPDNQVDNRVAEFISWLEKNPGSMLAITGYTDFIGTPEYNQKLGLERAGIVKQYLEIRGIAADRMITDSKAGDQLAADKITSAGRAKNRKTVITIKK
jgi:outer membrane protein OmpA-like peptidoglycan-associated protein